MRVIREGNCHALDLIIFGRAPMATKPVRNRTTRISVAYFGYAWNERPPSREKRLEPGDDQHVNFAVLAQRPQTQRQTRPPTDVADVGVGKESCCLSSHHHDPKRRRSAVACPCPVIMTVKSPVN